jgi:response regulator RpfG family c-di-GMP phosphodiesterase
MDVRGVTVLLVGKGAPSAPTLQNHLEKRGCEVCFATSTKEAIELLQRRRFDLVLSEFMLRDGTAYQLMPPLLGTATTMFFSNAVEDGCWWMTAVSKGKDRSEEPGMRPAEFRIRLDELLCDKLSRNTNNPASSCTDRNKEVPQACTDRAKVPARGHLRTSGSSRTAGANSHAES